MDKIQLCLNKQMIYNPKTQRCNKKCKTRNLVFNPLKIKCTKKCLTQKIRNANFRCVKPRPGPGPGPGPTILPINLQQAVIKNAGFIQEMIKKAPQYEASIENYYSSHTPINFIETLIQSYFYEKYNLGCPLYPIEYINITNDTKKERHANWKLAKFLKTIKLCLEKGEHIMLVSLTYEFGTMDNLNSHVNLIIIKPDTREIIRFEPHGNALYADLKNKDNMKINTWLRKIVQHINIYLNLTAHKFKYVPPHEICPRISPTEFRLGFQNIEGNVPLLPGEQGGFCLLWAWFFAECIMQNPDKSIKEVYLESLDSLKNQPELFRQAIRGYFIHINDELKQMGLFYKSIYKNNLEPLLVDEAQWEAFIVYYKKYFKNKNKTLKKRPTNTNN